MGKLSITAATALFRDMAKKDVRYVLNEAVNDVIEGAQTPQRAISAGATSFEVGKIPVDTSALINSLALNGSQFSGAPKLEGGAIDTFEWQTPYAARIEFGFTGTDAKGRRYNQAGRFFVTTHAQRFAEFVAKHAKEIAK